MLALISAERVPEREVGVETALHIASSLCGAHFGAGEGVFRVGDAHGVILVFGVRRVGRASGAGSVLRYLSPAYIYVVPP